MNNLVLIGFKNWLVDAPELRVAWIGLDNTPSAKQLPKHSADFLSFNNHSVFRLPRQMSTVALSSDSRRQTWSVKIRLEGVSPLTLI